MMNTIKAKDLINIFKSAVTNKHQILITGNAGIGKTSIYNQAINSLIKDGKKVISLVEIASVSDPTDYKGLPYMSEQGAEFSPIGLIKKILEITDNKKYKDYIISVFLDDLGQSTFAVQSALMQIIHDRKFNGLVIPENVVFMGATNRKQDRANVNGIIEPLKSRFHFILELTPDIDSWVQWAYNSGINPEIIGFLQFRPNFLVQENNTFDMVNGSNPRTINHASEILSGGYPETLTMQLISGACGDSFATEFMSFLQIYKNLPDIKNLIKYPENGAITDEPSVLYAICNAIPEKATKENFKNILIYSERLNGAFKVLLIKNCITKNCELAEVKEFTLWAEKNSDLFV